MTDKSTKFTSKPGIRETSGILAAILIVTLGAIGVVFLAAGMVYADSSRVNDDDHGADAGGAAQEAAVPGVTISGVSLVIPEGEQGTFTVKLDTMPSEDVGISFMVSSPTAFTLDPADLTFPTADWDEPQTVTVTTVADADEVSDRHTISPASSGGEYAAVAIEPIDLIITDGCDAIWCGIMDMTKTVPYELEFVSLDDVDFEADGVTHTISSALLHTRVLPGEEARPPFSIPERTSLRLWLNGGLAGSGYYSNWTLYVNDVELPFSQARVVFDDLEGNDRLLFKWYAPGLHRLVPNGQGEQGASWYLRIKDTGEPIPQPPGPPLYLRLASADPEDGSLILLWNRPHTMDDYYHELTEFKVQWKQTAGGWDTPADVSEATVAPQDNATHGHKIEGLEAGVEYDLRVIAVNEVGAGEPSEVFSTVVDPAAS